MCLIQFLLVSRELSFLTFFLDITLQGYVKSISSKGCFVMLSRHLDARVLLSNLTATEYENLDEEFPLGKLVEGRQVSQHAMNPIMVLMGVET